MKLLRNLDCYAPRPMGLKDILLAGGKIEAITEPGEITALPQGVQSADMGGMRAFPGIVDQHVHLLGGGGEGGPASRIGEVTPEEIIKAGVSTVVGVLGLDCYTRTMRELVMKARALGAAGISAYVYTGGYAAPPRTLTGSIADDLIFIDAVIGVGELAISDHRATLGGIAEFQKIAAEAHVGGLVGGKAGVVHIHVGDGAEGLDPLLRLLDRTGLLSDGFVPTHVNRNEALFRQAVKYCRSGGRIDLTAGESRGVPVPDAVARLIAAKADMSRVTVSSDGGGSAPGGTVSQMDALIGDIRSVIHAGVMEPGQAFALVSENASAALMLRPAKGALQRGADADLLITDGDCQPVQLFLKGNPSPALRHSAS